MDRLLCVLFLWSLPAVLSCGGDGDPVAPIASGPMQLMITSISPSDITDGVIDRDVNINTAAVGLWASYLRLVTDLCGRDPVGFTISALVVSLDLEASVNVSQLDQVMDGTVAVYLAAGGVTVDIGRGLPAGLGPVWLEEVSTQETLAALHDRMLASDFQVGLRAETSRTDGDDFSMDVEVSFRTRAFCQ